MLDNASLPKQRNNALVCLNRLCACKVWHPLPRCFSGKKGAHAPLIQTPNQGQKAYNTHTTQAPVLLARLLTFAVLGVSRGRDGGQAEEGCHKGGQEEEGEMGAHD